MRLIGPGVKVTAAGRAKAKADPPLQGRVVVILGCLSSVLASMTGWPSHHWATAAAGAGARAAAMTAKPRMRLMGVSFSGRGLKGLAQGEPDHPAIADLLEGQAFAVDDDADI